MTRYLASLVEQALWSTLNLGVNLLLIRLCAPQDYGAFAFWSTSAFVLASVQNALTVCHLQVLPPADGLHPARFGVERLMHAVTGLFLAAVAGLIAVAAASLGVGGAGFANPAAVLFVPAFLLQQYIRALAFSRGQPVTAAVQTGLVLALATVLVGGLAFAVKAPSADMVLAALGTAYGVVGVWGGARALKGQMRGFAWRSLAGFGGYAAQSGWIFLGVTTTELLARFYAFVVAGFYGAAALASLSATQLLLRPVPLLASSWSMVARADLARRREADDWGGFTGLGWIALSGGAAVAGVWTLLIWQAWPLIAARLFNGKYADDGWMVLLWGVSAALSFGQVVVGASLQVLRAFRALALSNAAASAVAAVAILIVTRLYGFGGAIAGTAAGQAFEFLVMGAVLLTTIRTLKAT